MIRFARTGAKMAVLAVVGATALAACGKSTSSTVQNLSPTGAFGKVPAQASGAEHSGTVTIGAPPSTAANWILPLITGADNSVFTVLDFDYQFYRPLYWSTNGVKPQYVANMSLANPPVWSNSDKTATITLKSNYKWSDGTPITSADVLFWWNIMKAAIKVSPANWADYTPGLGIPDQVSSISAPRWVANVRSPSGSTRATSKPVSRPGSGGRRTSMPSAASVARTRSPHGPVPWPPAYSTGRPWRAAAAMTLNPPPAAVCDRVARTSPPGSGSAGTFSTTSTTTLPRCSSLVTGLAMAAAA